MNRRIELKYIIIKIFNKKQSAFLVSIHWYFRYFFSWIFYVHTNLIRIKRNKIISEYISDEKDYNDLYHIRNVISQFCSYVFDRILISIFYVNDVVIRLLHLIILTKNMWVQDCIFKWKIIGRNQRHLFLFTWFILNKKSAIDKY